MATNSFAPDESLQPVHQADHAQFFKFPVTPQVQHEITPQNHMYPEKKIFGVRLVTFWLSFALCIVIIAGVIGAAIRGASAHANRCVGCAITGWKVVTATTVTATVTSTLATSASATPTSGFTNLSVPAPSAVTSLFLDCPAISSTTYTASNSSNIFAITCSIDYVNGFPGNKDITDIVAYSLQDCLQACSELVGNGIPCVGATFRSDMGAFPVGNCFLKGSLASSSPAPSNNILVFGRLLHQ